MRKGLLKIWAWMVLGWVSVLPIHAEDDVLFTVLLKDGQNYEFMLAQQPKIVFGTEGLEVQTSDMDVTLPSTSFGDIDRIVFKTDSPVTDLEDLAETIPSMRFQFLDGQTVVVDGVRGDAFVSQYSIDGKSVPLNVERSESRIVVHLNHLPKGIYILKIDNQSFKISKKS